MNKIKKKLNKLKRKLIRFVMWIIRECKNWQTILLLLIVATVIQLPTWGGYLLFFIFKWKWALAVGTIAAIFWAGPFSPFWVVSVTVTLAIKRMFERAFHRRMHMNENNDQKK